MLGLHVTHTKLSLATVYSKVPTNGASLTYLQIRAENVWIQDVCVCVCTDLGLAVYTFGAAIQVLLRGCIDPRIGVQRFYVDIHAFRGGYARIRGRCTDSACRNVKASRIHTHRHYLQRYVLLGTEVHLGRYVL